MAVFRVNSNKNYTVMNNTPLRDKELSLRAKGLLSVMLSLHEDWDYSINGLAAISQEGVKAIRSVLSELEEKGYLIRTKTKNEKGQFDYIYDIYETPQPQHREPYTPEGHAVEGHAVNGTQLNTKESSTNKSSTKELNNNIKETTKRFKKPTVEEIEAYCRERNNTIDANAFYDYYESKGWVVGKAPMKDWKATVRNWERKEKKPAADPFALF